MKQFQAPRKPEETTLLRRLKRPSLNGFRKDEDGVMVGFAVILVIMMIMVGGIGTDIMLAEMRRTQLQHTLDRAVLAAADLDQTRPANEIVSDYFEKSGIPHEIQTIHEERSLNHHEVGAVVTTSSTFAYSSVGTQFKHGAFGKEGDAAPAKKTVTIGAASLAAERIGNVEISLVLDVSGSMGSNSRLDNLKVAAKEFIDTMNETTQEDTTSISIVPYSAQVSVPDEVMAALSTSGVNEYANCLNFTDSDYSDVSISPTQTYDRTLHFTWSSSRYDNRPNNTPVNDSYIDCKTSSSRELAILQDDTTTLKNYIDNFSASGNTSIDTGMKWGTALLDPAFQPVVSSMIDASADNTGTINNAFEGRPFDYGSNESLKIVVLMSDGQNTRQHFVTDNYREGDSNVWYNEQEDFYSLYLGQDEGDDDGDGNYEEPIYYWPSQQTYRDHAYGEGTYETTETVNSDVCKSYRRNGTCRRYYKISKTVTVNEPGEAKVVSYPDLWAHTTPKYVADTLYSPMMGESAARNAWYYPVVDDVSYGAKDTRTRQICDAAKDVGIIVFTIGFEAPDAARVVLQDCASSDSHFFDVNGLEIRDAFAAIATSIRQLRLIQ